MNLFVFDTDMLTLFEEGESAVLAHVGRIPRAHIGTTIISVKEQLDGWNDRLPRARSRASIAAIYLRFTQAVQFCRSSPSCLSPNRPSKGSRT